MLVVPLNDCHADFLTPVTHPRTSYKAEKIKPQLDWYWLGAIMLQTNKYDTQSPTGSSQINKR